MPNLKPPVGHTCPDIDSVIRTVTAAASDINYLVGQAAEGSELANTLDATYESLCTVEPAMESLRSDNAALREWGLELAGQLGEIETMKDRIRELEWAMEDKNERIKTLEYDLQKSEDEVERLERELKYDAVS